MIQEDQRSEKSNHLKAITPVKSFGLKPRGDTVINLYDIPMCVERATVFESWLQKEERDGLGFYITGPAGSGKTTLAIALANQWNIGRQLERLHRIESASQDDQIRYYGPEVASGKVNFYDNVVPIDWYTLTSAYKVFSDKRTQAQLSLTNACETVNGRLIWILDDFAGGHMPEYVQDATETFIRNLYNESARVIITSNIPLDETGRIWNDQIRSRLTEMCVQVNLTGKDRRGK